MEASRRDQWHCAGVEDQFPGAGGIVLADGVFFFGKKTGVEGMVNGGITL